MNSKGAMGRVLGIVNSTMHSIINMHACVVRVDEFKQQLYFLNQNITSNSEKMRELHENTEQLLALFQKIDVMEVCMYIYILSISVLL